MSQFQIVYKNVRVVTFSTLLLVYGGMFDIKITIFLSNDSILIGYSDLKIIYIPNKQILNCLKNVRAVTSINWESL